MLRLVNIIEVKFYGIKIGSSLILEENVIFWYEFKDYSLYVDVKINIVIFKYKFLR